MTNTPNRSTPSTDVKPLIPRLDEHISELSNMADILERVVCNVFGLPEEPKESMVGTTKISSFGMPNALGAAEHHAGRIKLSIDKLDRGF